MKIPKPLLALALWFAAATALLATVPSSTTWVQYTLTTSPQTLTVPFVFQSASDLLVLDSRTSPPTTLTLSSDYSVSGGAGSTGTITTIPGGGGAVQVGDVITITRRVPLTQTTTYQNGGPLTPSTIGASVDKLTQITQQLNLVGALSLQFQKDEPVNGSNVLALSSRKNAFLAFDNNGAPWFPTTASIVGSVANPIVAASIAALRAIPVSGLINNAACNVAGYYSPSDGGGGVYVWNSSSTATDNAGTVIQPSGVTTGRWLLQYTGPINVRWFGAKGDGATDDTAAAQAAVNLAGVGNPGNAGTGRTVFFPNGNYVIGDLLLNQQGLRVVGESKYGTWLTAKAGASSIIKTDNLVSTNGRNQLCVEHLTLQYDNVTSSASNGALILGYSYGNALRDLYIFANNQRTNAAASLLIWTGVYTTEIADVQGYSFVVNADSGNPATTLTVTSCDFPKVSTSYCQGLNWIGGAVQGTTGNDGADRFSIVNSTDVCIIGCDVEGTGNFIHLNGVTQRITSIANRLVGFTGNYVVYDGSPSRLMLCDNPSAGFTTDYLWAFQGGASFANQVDTSGTKLTYYLDSSFTPSITFGGGSTGLSYAVRSGNYIRIGNTVTAQLFIQLSSKGSSTGSFLISGLPFLCADGNNNYTPVTVFVDNMAATFNAPCQGYVNPGTSTIIVGALSSGVFGRLDDTGFTNSSVIHVVVTYKAKN